MEFDKSQMIEALELCRQNLVETPLITSAKINNLVGQGNEIYFKCENFQKGGSYKTRGAYYAVSKLSQEEKNKGLVTLSSGNFGIAIALTSQMFNLKSQIVVPNNLPKNKKISIEQYGSELIYAGTTSAEMKAAMDEIVRTRGSTPVFSTKDVLIGQGTVTLEMIQQLGQTQLDYLLVPVQLIYQFNTTISQVSTGTLVSGALIACQYFSPHTKVIAIEPEQADDGYRSWKTGKLQPQSPPLTIADGCRPMLTEQCFEIIKKYLYDFKTVSEEEIINSTFLAWDILKIVIETSSAITIAALLKHRDEFQNKKIGVILSGGNVDFKALAPFM